MEQLEILLMIRYQMRQKHISASDMARKLGLNPSTVHGMLNRSTLQVKKLAELSELFQYNFFKEIASRLPYSDPEPLKEETNNSETAFKERIKALEMEVNILRQTLKDLVGR